LGPPDPEGPSIGLAVRGVKVKWFDSRQRIREGGFKNRNEGDPKKVPTGPFRESTRKEVKEPVARKQTLTPVRS